MLIMHMHTYKYIYIYIVSYYLSSNTLQPMVIQVLLLLLPLLLVVITIQTSFSLWGLALLVILPSYPIGLIPSLVVL